MLITIHAKTTSQDLKLFLVKPDFAILTRAMQRSLRQAPLPQDPRQRLPKSIPSPRDTTPPHQALHSPPHHHPAHHRHQPPQSGRRDCLAVTQRQGLVSVMQGAARHPRCCLTWCVLTPQSRRLVRVSSLRPLLCLLPWPPLPPPPPPPQQQQHKTQNSLPTRTHSCPLLSAKQPVHLLQPLPSAVMPLNRRHQEQSHCCTTQCLLSVL